MEKDKNGIKDINDRYNSKGTKPAQSRNSDHIQLHIYLPVFVLLLGSLGEMPM